LWENENNLFGDELMKLKKMLTCVVLVLSLAYAGTAAATPVYVTETGVQPGIGVNIKMFPYFNSVNAATGEYQIRIDSSGFWNAAWLFNKYGSAVTGVYNPALAANIQLAVWELVMDGVSGNTTTGNFQVLNNPALAASSQVYVTEALNNFNAAAFDQSAFHLLVILRRVRPMALSIRIT
jgi:hypothetical protein